MGGPLSERADDFPGGVLQHDTVLQPTECGGPLVNLDGKVVGINIARAGRVESYCLPANELMPLMYDLMSGRLIPPEIKAAAERALMEKIFAEKVAAEKKAAAEKAAAAKLAEEKAEAEKKQAEEKAEADKKQAEEKAEGDDNEKPEDNGSEDKPAPEDKPSDE